MGEDEYPPLLGAGLHPMTWAELKAKVVDGFPLSNSREPLWANFVALLAKLKALGIPCEIWVDGSLLQVDEIWAFVGAKKKNASDEKKSEGWGDVWTWTAICADTKLIPSWYVGSRDTHAASIFMQDLKSRLASRVQLTSDGYKIYMAAVEAAYPDWAVDYAMLVKHYGAVPDGASQRRYSPAECVGVSTNVISGTPDKKHVSTSFAERSNLTLRMGCRRFTRLTNAFSKKIENHAWAVALHMLHYNFGRVHKTLRVTPAMQAGVADHVWSLEEIAALGMPQAPAIRGPYQKRAKAA